MVVKRCQVRKFMLINAFKVTNYFYIFFEIENSKWKASIVTCKVFVIFYGNLCKVNNKKWRKKPKLENKQDFNF